MNLARLQQIALSESMIPGAPVKSTRSIVIEAALNAVWKLQTDVQKWPDWYPYLKNARLHGNLQPGTKLTYGGLFKHKLQVATVRREQLVMVFGTYIGFVGITKWEFAALSSTSTEVRFSESSDGFLMGALYSNDKLAEHLDDWLKHLKAASERRK